MNAEIKRWQEGPVNRKEEHFELRFGSAEHGGWDEWIPIAVIGPPEAGGVNVRFLTDSSDDNSEAITKVKHEIQFYLLDLGEPDPWRYAQYHCGTSSNFYSHVHWSYFEQGNGDPTLEEAALSSDLPSQMREVGASQHVGADAAQSISDREIILEVGGEGARLSCSVGRFQKVGGNSASSRTNLCLMMRT